MKKLLRILTAGVFSMFAFAVSDAQIVDIVDFAGTSGTPALGSSTYAANESIYTDAEIGSNNFTTTGSAIERIGFTVATVGSNTTFSNVSIYMKDVPITTTTLASGTYSLTGYTLVYNGAATFAATGFSDIILQTPYVRASGTNLQVLIIRADGLAHTSYVWNCARGNSTDANLTTTRRYNSTSAPVAGSTTLTASNFRQAIRLKHIYANDAGVNAIYTLGKLPLSYAWAQTISASITNFGQNTLTNFNVTLDITGANFYNNSQIVSSLAPGASTVVTFPAANLFSTGTNNVSVTLPFDDNLSNNVKTMTQDVNANTWSYAYGPTPSGGVGFTGGTGDFVARFNTNTTTFLTQVSVNFSAGGQPFKIGIWNANGTNGTPGTLVWESTVQTSTSGLYVMPVVPAQSIIAGDFYVGVRQTGTTNVSFAYQTETPIRSSNFYYASPTGSTTWVDFAPNSPFRFMIEPKLILPDDASLSALILNSGTTNSCANNVAPIVKAVVTNTGANAIQPNAATVTYQVSGANSYVASGTNLNTITTGASDTVYFTNIPAFLPGANYDTAYVVLANDAEPANDTLKVTRNITPVNTNYPIEESYESTPYTIGQLTQLAGTGTWVVQTTPYKNGSLSDSLRAHSGSRFALFDCFSFATGTSARIYSTSCIAVPPTGVNPCNNPGLSFWMSHDNNSTLLDSLYISVSVNGSTWTRLGGYRRYNATFTAPGWKKEIIDLTPYAGQTIQIGFEAIGKLGNAIGLDDINIGPMAIQRVNLATNASNSINLQSACVDQGWTYYVDPVLPNDYLIAIEWDPNNVNANTAAKAVAIPKIQVDATNFSVVDIPNQNATYSMKRYWNVDVFSVPLTAPVNLRFFYDSSEINQVTAAVDNFITTNGGNVEPPVWFKTVSGNFLPSLSSMDAIGVFNAMPLTNANVSNNKIGGVTYAQFNGITSFSGGTYAAGVGNNTPLPITLSSIEATSLGSKNLISWSMNTDPNTDHFILEKGNSGTEFTTLEKITVTNNINYSAYDYNPRIGVNYYRLMYVDRSGSKSYSKVVSVRNDNLATVSVFPNPIKDMVNIRIVSDNSQSAIINILDVTGKMLMETSEYLTQGQNTVSLSAAQLVPGTYTVKVVMNEKTVVEKFVKR